ncbi:MAG: STAS domain-containing protein [Candidatus Eremiobacteraeota bacterium]|nr:STAS domain-containing protein [Candidatus Eremiobacteraeota bacterium]
MKDITRRSTFMYLLENQAGTPVVRVRGEVDITTAGKFRNSLTAALEHADGRIVVALDECTYFDSTAVGILIGTQKKVGDRLVVAVPEAGSVRRMLDISGVSKYVALVRSVDEALATA